MPPANQSARQVMTRHSFVVNEHTSSEWSFGPERPSLVPVLSMHPSSTYVRVSQWESEVPHLLRLSWSSFGASYTEEESGNKEGGAATSRTTAAIGEELGIGSCSFLHVLCNSAPFGRGEERGCGEVCVTSVYRPAFEQKHVNCAVL